MIVSNEQYDTQAPDMHEHAVTPLRWEFDDLKRRAG